MDRISKLPQGIIENILCLLPIQEAARTSILSREWRYHWISIPQLVFIENQFQVSTDRAKLFVSEQTSNKPPTKKQKRAKRSKLLSAIYQVLLIHQGPIREFYLRMEVDDSCVEIDHIMLHLSMKTSVEYLKLDFSRALHGEPYGLPISLFSLRQLRGLYLQGCALFHERPFNELGCLTSLYLGGIHTSEKTLLRLLSSCPLLKRLTIASCSVTIMSGGETPIADLFECLPVIERLTVSFFIVMCFVPEKLPKKLPKALVHLKYLCMAYLCFRHLYGLPFLALLIRSSPNLEKLKLMMVGDFFIEEDEMASLTLEDCSNITLEHLNELEIDGFSDAENELDFVKLILAKSPVLKKVSIYPWGQFDEDQASQVLESLSNSPCASPEVKLFVGLGS